MKKLLTLILIGFTLNAYSQKLCWRDNRQSYSAEIYSTPCECDTFPQWHNRASLDTINGAVVEAKWLGYNYDGKYIDYLVETSDGSALCDETMYDHIKLNVTSRVIFLVAIDGSKWLIKIEEY